MGFVVECRNGAAREGAGAGLETQKILIKVSFLEHIPISLKNKIILICSGNIWAAYFYLLTQFW